MEIDLIMGLAKPKIALTKLPTLEGPGSPMATLPDFSALLEGAIPADSALIEGAPTLEVMTQISVPMPQEEALGDINTPELQALVSVEVDAKPTADAPQDPNDLAALPPPNMPIIPPQTRAEVLFSSPLARERSAEKPAINTPSAITLTKPEQAIKTAESATTPLVTSDKLQKPEPWQNRIISTEAPASIAPKLTPDPKAATAQVLPLPFEKAIGAIPTPAPNEPDIKPDVKLDGTPVLPTAKVVVQQQAQPAPQIGFGNIETVKDDPAEIQFGIKIERQPLETVSISRPAPQAAPVASQITAQLPQLLTKADKQTIELRLDPPELGRVTIHLTTNDQQVTALVVADRPDTVELMRRHAELLAATLARAGFSQADLSFQQGQSQNNKGEFEQFQSASASPESDELAITTATLAGQDGRLDIRL